MYKLSVMAKLVEDFVYSNTDRSTEKMATENSGDGCNVLWPSIAGPQMPNTNSKLGKTSGSNMNSSLARLRRELASMQQQDRGLHKQLLALNSSIRDLKKCLNDSWDVEDHIDTNSIANQSSVDDAAVRDTAPHSEPQRTQVSHSKQDSGILTDEESNEENDVFDIEGSWRLSARSRSASAICLRSGLSSELDINQNVKTTSSSQSFRGYNIPTTPRPRSHTICEGHFHRVTSMPVINEDQSPTARSMVSGMAFAISGYLNKPGSVRKASLQHTPHHAEFHPLSRHESMPDIPSFEVKKVRHVRSETVPAFRKTIPNNFIKSGGLSTDKTNKKKPLYRIWRSSSQISLV